MALAYLSVHRDEFAAVERAAAFALELAVEFGDSDLEVLALVESGFEYVAQGRAASAATSATSPVTLVPCLDTGSRPRCPTSDESEVLATKLDPRVAGSCQLFGASPYLPLRPPAGIDEVMKVICALERRCAAAADSVVGASESAFPSQTTSRRSGWRRRSFRRYAGYDA